MPPRQGLPRRQVRQTALLVGEGLAEETFLRHLKSLYLARGDGRSVAIKNAKGKGGKHVLDYTIGQRKTADYDELAALLDTDTDWGDAQKVQIHLFDDEVIWVHDFKAKRGYVVQGSLLDSA